MQFEHFNLKPEINAGIKAAGFTTPTPIQARAIPVALQGHDLMGLAQTGTGKTAAFVLPLLQRLMNGTPHRVRALIVAPTRELAEQIHETINLLARHTQLRSMTIYGGVSIVPQIRTLKRGVDILVACPGRLLDHLNQKTIDLSQIEMLVLDEADRMFDMGFLPGIRKIVQKLPQQRQTLLFSATMPKEILKLAANGDIIHNDDTTMRVLSQMKEIEAEKEQNIKAGKKDGRTGIFTTGIVSRTKTKDNERDIVLFFTGRQHAGENLNDILKHRDLTKDPPILMCDALSRNEPKDFETETCYCNVHARRGFADVVDVFDEAVFVIKQYKELYKNEAFCQQEKMNDGDRLAYHQQHSAPIMAAIIKWCNDKIANKEVEPNSSLGGAIKYTQNHWDKLTCFLRVPGAPLDNNIAERKLKYVILHRKNSLFYKTEMGAKVGDIMMSLIQTCVKSDLNPLDYLIAIQDHAKEVFKNPKEWLPWNYQGQLQTLSNHH